MTPAQHNKALRAKRKEAGMVDLRLWLSPEGGALLDRLCAKYAGSRREVAENVLEIALLERTAPKAPRSVVEKACMCGTEVLTGRKIVCAKHAHTDGEEG